MLFHSYGFDFSVWEMWGALGYGGKLVVVGEEEAKDAERDVPDDREEGSDGTEPNTIGISGIDGRGRENGETRGEAGGMKLRVVIFGGEALEAAEFEGVV